MDMLGAETNEAGRHIAAGIGLARPRGPAQQALLQDTREA